MSCIVDKRYVDQSEYYFSADLKIVRDAEGGIQKVLDLLSNVLIQDVKQAEANFTSVWVTYGKLVENILKFDEEASARLAPEEAEHARAQWLEALDKVSSIEIAHFHPNTQFMCKRQ